MGRRKAPSYPIRRQGLASRDKSLHILFGRREAGDQTIQAFVGRNRFRQRVWYGPVVEDGALFFQLFRRVLLQDDEEFIGTARPGKPCARRSFDALGQPVRRAVCVPG